MKKILLGLVAAATLLPGAALAEQGDWRVRARIIGATPDESSTVSLGGEAMVGDAVAPEVDFSYFFTDHIAAELILGTTEHKVRWSEGPTNLGKVRLLPPTLTLQYHLLPESRIQPYVGAGVNYTMFYDVQDPAGLKVEYDDNFGYALQAGVDFMFDDTYFANVDVKKLFLQTDVSINDGAITADVDIDPWIIGFGIGRKF